MKGNELLDKIGLIDPSYIEAADIEVKKRKPSGFKWGAVAACIAVVMLAGISVLSRNDSTFDTELPELYIIEDISGRGFEGYMAYDIYEIIGENPWEGSFGISALPVYENPLTYNEDFIAIGADYGKMKALLLDVAERMGLDRNNVEITDNAPDEETKQMMIEKLQLGGSTVPNGYFDPTALIIKADGFEIQVDQSLTATVYFDPPVSLPEKYNFTHYASYKDKADVAEYLKEEYREFIGIDDPKVNIYGGDYNIYEEQQYDIGFFDDSGNKVERIINYNFNRVTFHCDDNGDLFIARIYQPDLSKKIGEYPIISEKQAKELLLNGNYITSVPYEVKDKAYVKKVELVYRAGIYEKFFMPYYKFYVELSDEERENGLKTYGAYYVPAVEGDYISNMPVWDGGFNN